MIEFNKAINDYKIFGAILEFCVLKNLEIHIKSELIGGHYADEIQYSVHLYDRENGKFLTEVVEENKTIEECLLTCFLKFSGNSSAEIEQSETKEFRDWMLFGSVFEYLIKEYRSCGCRDVNWLMKIRKSKLNSYECIFLQNKDNFKPGAYYGVDGILLSKAITKAILHMIGSEELGIGEDKVCISSKKALIKTALNFIKENDQFYNEFKLIK